MTYVIRPLSKLDVDVICGHREQMFREAGFDDSLIMTMINSFRPWLSFHLSDERYFGRIIEDSGEIAAGVGMMILDWPPHPRHPMEAHRGYVLNLFVEPRYRRAGLAKALMDEVQQEAAGRGVSFWILHPTAVAEPLYRVLGWRPSGELCAPFSDLPEQSGAPQSHD